MTAIRYPVSGSYSLPMLTILLVADRQSVIDQIHTALSTPDIVVIDHPDSDTAADTAYSEDVDAVLVDMQVGSMGAMAVTRAIRAKAEDGIGIPVTQHPSYGQRWHSRQRQLDGRRGDREHRQVGSDDHRDIHLPCNTRCLHALVGILLRF